MDFESLKKLLFLLPTEASHHVSMRSVSLLSQLGLSSLLARDVPRRPVTAMGIEFPNAVGLAAGLDKDARYIDGLADLGFGFIEVGTVTPRPQPGNPKPRLFRLPAEDAIINRMGFNNDGLDDMIRRIRRTRFDGVLGINIGKNFDTPVENALDDYVTCLRRVYRHASYIVVNISSPNTPGLRTLQQGDELPKLLDGLKEAHADQAVKHEKHVPLVIKIAPDMTDEELTAVADELLAHEIDGVIVGNTTVARPGLDGSRWEKEAGGLSGAPLKPIADGALKVVADHVGTRMTVVGVGGILEGRDAADKIALGASLVQLYTGFIYRGPDLIRECVDAIEALRDQRSAA